MVHVASAVPRLFMRPVSAEVSRCLPKTSRRDPLRGRALSAACICCCHCKNLLFDFTSEVDWGFRAFTFYELKTGGREA